MGRDGDAVAHRERAIHTIGNLTLVNNRLNAALSNAPWHEKRGTLADHSVLFLNKHLVNDFGPSAWAEGTIEGRAKWLYQIAARIWPHCIGSVNEFLVDLEHAPVLPGRMEVSPEVKPPEHTGELGTSGFDVVATSHYGTESDTALQIVPSVSQNKNGESLQDIVRDLMLTVLETFTGTLDEETIRHLEAARNPLGLNIKWSHAVAQSLGRTCSWSAQSILEARIWRTLVRLLPMVGPRPSPQRQNVSQLGRSLVC